MRKLNRRKERYQHKGYGSEAIKLLFEYFKSVGAKQVKLSFEKENTIAAKSYLKSGFSRTGQLYDGEIEMYIDL